jgi:hypothetical protein
MTREDREHLKGLVIGHYAVGALCALLGFLPIFHLAIGIAIVTEAFPMQPAPNQQGNQPPFGPEFMGWIFIGFAAVFMLFYWGLAGALLIAGRCLSQRKAHTFCLIVAAAVCLFQPIGLVLGVFTFIVLLRPSVREAFQPVREEPPEHDQYQTE